MPRDSPKDIQECTTYADGARARMRTAPVHVRVHIPGHEIPGSRRADRGARDEERGTERGGGEGLTEVEKDEW